MMLLSSKKLLHKVHHWSRRTKICTICKIDKHPDRFSKRDKRKDGLRGAYCRECDGIRKWRRTNTLDGCMMKLARAAKFRNKQWNSKDKIDADVLKEKWSTQKGLCYLSGIPMSHNTNADWKCSIERLENKKAYCADNVVLICQEFNTPTQWNHEFVDNLPNKIKSFADAQMLGFIFSRMHQLEPLAKGRKCAFCAQNKPKGSNLFCEQCKTLNIEIIKHWDFIRIKLHGAKSSSIFRGRNSPQRGVYDLSPGWAQMLLKQQKYRCYYSNIPLEFKHGSPWAISPERLNNDYGYTQNNTRFICALFQSAENAHTKYDVNGSPQWNRKKINKFLMLRHGISIDYSSMFT